jgi:hypothetical protein
MLRVDRRGRSPGIYALLAPIAGASLWVRGSVPLLHRQGYEGSGPTSRPERGPCARRGGFSEPWSWRAPSPDAHSSGRGTCRLRTRHREDRGHVQPFAERRLVLPGPLLIGLVRVKEGVLEFHPDVKLLAFVSPSRFTALEGCALKEVWGANKAPPLLPSAPVGHLGSTIHQLLQEAGRGRFTIEDGASIDRRWQELIEGAQRTMHRSWLERHFVPLELSVSDYEVRLIQARNRALEIVAAAPSAPARGSTKPSSEGTPKYGFELPVSSPDGMVRGRIDAVFPHGYGRESLSPRIRNPSDDYCEHPSRPSFRAKRRVRVRPFP